MYDNSTREFVGIITYQTLNRFLTIQDALRTEYLVLNESIWINARDYCKRHPYSGIEYLIPVLNPDRQLICFAYEDLDANREIRMLGELTELTDAIQFANIYPQYKCVRIYGFNELAYFFAQYLESQNIAVQVEGEMWKGFFLGADCAVFDYECLNVYAEGTWEGKHNWKENLLRSVSVEFECIDKIYEVNIKNNLIRDAIGEEDALFERLRGEAEIILCGTGMRTQEAYDFLLENGIDICCFMTEDINIRYRMFGKKISGLKEVIYTYQNPVFIDCESKNSAWGFGKVDYYDYMGYKRNQKFILLRDYCDISGRSMVNALRIWKIVLLGDWYLCKYLETYLSSKSIAVIGYLDISNQDNEQIEMNITTMEGYQDILWLLVAPDFYTSNDHNVHALNEFMQNLIEYLGRMNVNNYSDYFSYAIAYMDIEKNHANKWPNKKLMPKKVVVGAIESTNGTTLLAGLLDEHPNVLLILKCYSFKDNLFWTSLRLSTVKAKEILSAFWSISEEWDYGWCHDPARFNEKMSELLSYSDQYTSQEIFVIIFISYMYMYGRDIEIADSIIYWDPHYLASDVKEDSVKWLGAEQMHCDIINVVRNAYMVSGSLVKGFISLSWTGTGVAALINAYTAGVYKFCNIEKKTYKWSDRLIIKFEELKCYPKEILTKICEKLGIIWSDSLLKTTKHGEEWVYNNGEKTITDFDLSPVYNTYEKYFTELDRLRIMIIQALWQKKYGYPYIELKHFSRKELQEMFLKKFYFESLMDLEGERLDLKFRMKLQFIIREQVQKIKMEEIMAERS